MVGLPETFSVSCSRKPEIAAGEPENCSLPIKDVANLVDSGLNRSILLHGALPAKRLVPFVPTAGGDLFGGLDDALIFS